MYTLVSSQEATRPSSRFGISVDGGLSIVAWLSVFPSSGTIGSQRGNLHSLEIPYPSSVPHEPIANLHAHIERRRSRSCMMINL